MRYLLLLPALAACVPGGTDQSAATPARLEAERIAASFAPQVGQGQAGIAITEVRVTGEDVELTVGLPTPAAGLAPEQREAISAGVADAFGPQVCAQADLTALYAAGGAMRVIVESSDDIVMASVPIDCT